VADKAWKKAEREVAKMLGGHRRLRHTGEPGGDPGDVLKGSIPFIDSELFVDVKYRAKTHSAINWWLEAKAKAKPDDVPLIVLRQGGLPTPFVVLGLEQLMGLIKMAYYKGLQVSENEQ